MNRNHPLAAVVLAAGSSRRFRSDKRFAITASGSSLLQSTLRSLAGHVDEIYVAIKPDEVMDDRFPAAVSGQAVVYVRASRASQGMGCSLADVVRHLPAGSDVIIALADMPYVHGDTVSRLVEHFRSSVKSAPIAFPVLATPSSAGDPEDPSGGVAGRRGHPVIFHRSYREQLEALHGDTGASRVIESHRDAHEPLEVDDPGVILDVDLPADLKRA
jgi:molybdenum cofactor cytidylyltransferase